MLRKLLLLIVLAAVVLTSAANAGPMPGNRFLIGFWCAPPPNEPIEERYSEIAKANFTVTFPPCGGANPEYNKVILDTCQKYGLKAVIADERLMAKEPNDPDFEKNIDAVLAEYGDHPALYGFDLRDEPNAGLFPKLGAVSQYIMKKKPGIVPYINLLPTYGNGAMWGTPTYQEHVNQFMETVKPNLLSYDHYALLGEGLRGDYFQNMEIIRDAALKNNVPWMNIILASPHYGYRNPTEGDLRWQVYTTLAYGGTGISYFTYWTLTGYDNFRNAIMEKGGKQTEHYPMVQKLNAEMLKLAPTLMKLTSTEVYHTAPVPQGAKEFPADNKLIKSVQSAEMILGFFEGSTKSNWVMLTNRDMRKPAEATVTLARKMTVKELDKTTGKAKVVQLDKANPTVLKLKFEPGEGRLFQLVSGK